MSRFLQFFAEPITLQSLQTISLLGTRTVTYGKMDDLRLESLEGVGPVTSKTQ